MQRKKQKEKMLLLTVELFVEIHEEGGRLQDERTGWYPGEDVHDDRVDCHSYYFEVDFDDRDDDKDSWDRECLNWLSSGSGMLVDQREKLCLRRKACMLVCD